MERYIGLDAHAMSCTFAVISPKGKRLKSAVVETQTKLLVDFIKTVPHKRYLCLEESTLSGWLYEILKQHVDQIVVTRIQKSSAASGIKDDLHDAFKLANDIRMGNVKPIFKERGSFSRLRSLNDVYIMTLQENVRLQNRIKALYLSRGVKTPGDALYKVEDRNQWLNKIPIVYRTSAEILHNQYDSLRESMEEAQKSFIAESRKHSIVPILRSCPGMGDIRVAQFVSIIITPYRFRTKRQLWAYCGLGIVTLSSDDWLKTPNGWKRTAQVKTRGLNRNFNRILKFIFIGAATTIISQRLQPWYTDYQRLLEQGTNPSNAKITIARKVSATILAMWKNKQMFDPKRSGS